MKRVLLKLSGEALAGEKKTGFDEATCIGVAKQVKQLVDEGVQVAIVTGGDKAAILKEVLYGPITPEVPASILQLHNDVTIVADAAALSKINM